MLANKDGFFDDLELHTKPDPKGRKVDYFNAGVDPATARIQKLEQKAKMWQERADKAKAAQAAEAEDDSSELDSEEEEL